MKNPELNHIKATNLLARLTEHPTIMARVESLLDLIENVDNDVITADAAEMRTINELRQMGNELLHGWANNNVEKANIAAMIENDFKKKE